MPHPSRRLRRPLTIAGGVAAALIAAVVIGYRAPVQRAAASSPAAVATAAPATAMSTRTTPAPEAVSESVTIPAHSNFAAACAPFHLGAQLLQQLVAVARPVFNLGRIQAGNTLTLVRDAGGALQALSYQIDDNHRLWLRALPVEAAGANPAVASAPAQWAASIETIRYETRLAAVSGTIQSSLFQGVEDAGERDQLALEMADIFGWDLDFYTDPQPGDVFRVLVEKQYLNGKFSRYGQIVAAEYVNAGHKYDAVRFHDEAGELAYYRPDGQPMKREFLRSPLKFVALHVTSPFTRRRYHPILKVYRAHLGVDYGAPRGTPVQAIGSGVVMHAGRKGEDGNMVQIRHADGYETFYLHLSRILVHTGEHVAQGERIGLVGMTGLATGPHLDFRIEHDGQFEDFERVRKTLPPAQPVAAPLMAEFRQLTDRYMPKLAALQPAVAPATDAAIVTAPAP